MGHTRLGTIPKSRKWQAVVSEVVETGDDPSPSIRPDAIARIALRTLEAAQAGLDKANDDIGLRFTFYLLTQVVLSAREEDWQTRLADFGIRIAEDAGLFDLTAEMQNAIDEHIAAYGRSTDVSAMAKQSAGEALTTLVGPRAVTLFGAGRDELTAAVRPLSTTAGFAELGQLFFGRFIARFLNFYLSRITVSQVGGGRLNQVGDLTRFNDALEAHCFQSARIVRDFCGEWYSKTEFQESISLHNTSRFLAVALEKLRAELKQQGVAS